VRELHPVRDGVDGAFAAKLRLMPNKPQTTVAPRKP
jgi:hypothetical protein